MATLELVLCKDFAATGTIEYSTTSSAGPWVGVTLSADLPVREALADWASQISTAISPEVATFSYAAGVVTLECTDVVWFRLTPCLADLLGFTAQVNEAGESSDTTPTGIGEFLFGHTFPMDVEDGEIQTYRSGRQSAYHHGRAIEIRASISVPADVWTTLRGTPLVTGHGAFKATLDNATDWGEDDIDGAMLCFPFGTPSMEQDGPEEYVRVGIRATMLDPGATLPTIRSTAYARAMGATRYGYAPQYWARVEGVSVLLGEFLGDAVAPTGYTLDRSLVIDRSSKVGNVIDPKTHFAAGYDAEMRLLDSTAVRALMTRPTRYATLAADVTASATTFTVRDTIGDWSDSDSLYIGTSLETKAGEGVGTFTGITRGAYGRTRSYKAGTIIADSPYEWKGRRVEIFLTLRDPSGRYVQITDVLDETPAEGDELVGTYGARKSAVKLWDGYVIARPERDGTDWVVPVRDQARRLTQPLGVAASGRALWQIDDDGMVPVDAGATVTLTVSFDTSPQETLALQPFVGQPAVLRRSQIRALIASAFEAAVTSGKVHDFAWRRFNPTSPNPGIFDVFHLWFAADVTSSDHHVNGGVSVHSTAVMAPVIIGSLYNVANPALSTTTIQVDTGFSNPTTVGQVNLSVVLDEGDATSLPTAGWVVIEGNGKTSYKAYTSLAVDDSDPSQVNLVLDPSTPFSQEEIAAITGDPNQTIGTASDVGVKFFWKDTGKIYDILRRAIVSTGDAINGTYDTLPKGQGLGLPDIDAGSFEDVFDGFYRDLTAAIGTESGTSLQEVFAGLLRLSQRGLAGRRSDDGSAVEISAVRVGSVDALPVATLTDATFASRRGARPIRVMSVYAAPQAIGLKCRTLPIDDAPAGEGPISLKDPHLVDWTADAWDLDIYGFSRSAILGAAKTWALAWFRAGENRQVIELDVPPWIDAQAGDVVALDVQDPNVWDYAAGSAGLRGNARVLGSQLSLVSGLQTLTVAVDGLLSPGPMCPSIPIAAVVSGFAFYRSDGAGGSYADASTNVAARAVFAGTGVPVCTVVCWARDTPANYLYSIGDPADALPRMVAFPEGDLGIELIDAVGGGSSGTYALPDPADATFHHYAVVVDGANVAAWGDGVNDGGSVAASGTYATADVLRLLDALAGGGESAGDIAAFAIFDRAMSSGEIADLYAAGPGHDLTTATGAYATADPVILWDRADVAGSVANRGSGGTCALTFHGGVTSETEAGALTAIDVSEEWYAILVNAKGDASTFKLLAYLPGQDSGRAVYTVSTIGAPDGGFCRITVTAEPTSPAVTLTTSHRLTWVISDDCTPEQAVYLHSDDRVMWS